MEKLILKNRLLTGGLVASLFCLLILTIIYVVPQEVLYRRIEKVLKFKNIVYYGDSRIAWNRWRNWGVHSEVFGIPSAITADLVTHVHGCVVSYHPDKCVLEMGINDIRQGVPVQTTYKNYRMVVDTLLKFHITPVVNAVFYVNNKNDHTTNMKIDMLNDLLRTYCASKDIQFVDINSTLSEGHHLSTSYSDDGIHLNQHGYAVWEKTLSSYR